MIWKLRKTKKNKYKTQNIEEPTMDLPYENIFCALVNVLLFPLNSLAERLCMRLYIYKQHIHGFSIWNYIIFIRFFMVVVVVCSLHQISFLPSSFCFVFFSGFGVRIKLANLLFSEFFSKREWLCNIKEPISFRHENDSGEKRNGNVSLFFSLKKKELKREWNLKAFFFRVLYKIAVVMTFCPRIFFNFYFIVSDGNERFMNFHINWLIWNFYISSSYRNDNVWIFVTLCELTSIEWTKFDDKGNVKEEYEKKKTPNYHHRCLPAASWLWRRWKK